MVGDSTQVKTPTGAPCAMAVSYMTRMASWQQCQAFGWGAKITAFRVLMAMMHLKSTVDVGLVTQSTSAMFEALRQKLGPQVQSVRADRENEVYVLLRDADIRPITEHPRGEFGARLVTVFAEDRRSAEGVFFNYYIFEQKGSAQ